MQYCVYTNMIWVPGDTIEGLIVSAREMSRKLSKASIKLASSPEFDAARLLHPTASVWNTASAYIQTAVLVIQKIQFYWVAACDPETVSNRILSPPPCKLLRGRRNIILLWTPRSFADSSARDQFPSGLSAAFLSESINRPIITGKNLDRW